MIPMSAILHLADDFMIPMSAILHLADDFMIPVSAILHLADDFMIPMSAILHLADDFFRKEKMPILILKLIFNIFNGEVFLKFHLIIQRLFYCLCINAIKFGLSTSKNKITLTCSKESPLKIMNKYFYFILKAFSVLKISKFLS